MMEVVVQGDNWTTGAISCAKLQSNHHHQQTNIQFFLQAGCPSCRPTDSVKALKEEYCLMTTTLVWRAFSRTTRVRTGISPFWIWLQLTVGLASHWPRVTHISGSPPTGSKPRRGRWAPAYALLWSMVDFTFYKDDWGGGDNWSTTRHAKLAKLQSNCHHKQTCTQLFASRMAFLSPNHQCQSTDEKEECLKMVWVSVVGICSNWQPTDECKRIAGLNGP